MEPSITGVDEVGGSDIKVVMDRILEGQEDIAGGSEGDGGDSEFTLGKKEDEVEIINNQGNKRITEVSGDVRSFEGQDRFEKAVSDTVTREDLITYMQGVNGFNYGTFKAGNIAESFRGIVGNERRKGNCFCHKCEGGGAMMQCEVWSIGI